MIHSKDLNFSFSGIKTHVLYTLQKIETLDDTIKKKIAREFEDAVTEVLISKTRTALESAEYKTIIVGGGVIANTHIRDAFTKLAEEFSIPLYLPASGLTGDNALMREPFARYDLKKDYLPKIRLIKFQIRVRIGAFAAAPT